MLTFGTLTCKKKQKERSTENSCDFHYSAVNTGRVMGPFVPTYICHALLNGSLISASLYPLWPVAKEVLETHMLVVSLWIGLLAKAIVTSRVNCCCGWGCHLATTTAVRIAVVTGVGGGIGSLIGRGGTIQKKKANLTLLQVITYRSPRVVDILQKCFRAFIPIHFILSWFSISRWRSKATGWSLPRNQVVVLTATTWGPSSTFPVHWTMMWRWHGANLYDRILYHT